jgi:hypothetical protein
LTNPELEPPGGGGSRLAGRPTRRIVGAETMKFASWQRLNAEYAKQFGVETPGWKGKH